MVKTCSRCFILILAGGLQGRVPCISCHMASSGSEGKLTVYLTGHFAANTVLAASIVKRSDYIFTKTALSIIAHHSLYQEHRVC